MQLPEPSPTLSLGRKKREGKSSRKAERRWLFQSKPTRFKQQEAGGPDEELSSRGNEACSPNPSTMVAPPPENFNSGGSLNTSASRGRSFLAAVRSRLKDSFGGSCNF